MSMSFGYGPAGEKQEMLSLLRSAVERGVTFFDTAQVYGPFTNEELLGEALGARDRRRLLQPTGQGFPDGEDRREHHVRQLRLPQHRPSLHAGGSEGESGLRRSVGAGRRAEGRDTSSDRTGLGACPEAM